MISKNTKKIISLAMSITVSGSVIPALTTSAVAVFAEENKTKTEDNNEVKDKLNNISQSTTGQSVNLLDANENSDGYGIDLYADEPWTTPDAFTGEGSIVTIKGIKFTLKDDNTVEISNGKSYSQPELILPEKITIDGIEYEVTSVGNFAFSGCGSLESVSMPEVTYLGEWAFSRCKSLKEISLPEVTSVGKRAFNRCESLKEISLLEVTSVGEWAFGNCGSLESVSMPEVTYLGNDAFSGCGSLESVSMPEVKSVDQMAFYRCESLKEISMPEVTYLGNDAFQDCTNLESIILPEVEYVDVYAFYGCNNIKNAVVSDKLEDTTKIPSESIIKINNTGDGYKITNIEKKSGDGKIILPSEIGGKPITDISDDAIEVIKNNEDKVEIDGRNVFDILKNKNVDISKMDVKNVTFGNKTALEEYYKQNSAAKYSKNDYPEDIYNAYEKSLRKADEVLKDKYVSQEDVDSTLEDFKNAVSELIKIDKNKLIELYGKYKDIKQGNYTSESYGKFTEALKKAETVINNGNAIQNDINNAFKSLQDAVNGLKEKSSSSSSSHRSSSEKTSESEVKSVESVTPEKPDNETSTAIQYKEGWNKNGESWIYVKNGVPAT
ncbi:leucine-rich repeat protein [Clostridium neonatale]|uniref:leucine-rich repeat protein n=1 Tax=Clostridium neonatale TaxID=137838 RepID=UPI00291BD103|nr:leucine-rich repeat protein [Clostridium neonatale]CAI3214580.1 exported hypothetical protein [Clostridium neonatale]